MPLEGVTWLMFDFYGTVVDMQSGLEQAIAPFLRGKGSTQSPGQVVTRWRRTHFETSMSDALLQREHTPYRVIGERAVSYTLERHGIDHSPEDAARLVSAIERLDPFADVPAALDRLRGRYRLAVLSNGDPDMLERGVAHAGVPFDRVISVAEAGAFKPHRATYAKAAELVGARPEEICFVANHAFDVVGAKAFGMRSAFVNRRGVPFGAWQYKPDLVVADFASLAGALA